MVVRVTAFVESASPVPMLTVPEESASTPRPPPWADPAALPVMFVRDLTASLPPAINVPATVVVVV